MTDIKMLRTRLGFSQEALARKLGVAVNSVRYWEHGGKPSLMAQERIDQFISQHADQMKEVT